MNGFFTGRICAKTLGFILIVLTFAIFIAAWKVSAGLNFVLVMCLMCLFCGFIGRHTNGRYLGILISDRNVMSLSRFQTVAWTVVILSAYIVIAVARTTVDSLPSGPGPLDITIDYRLWIMMGISATSLVATPMILANKAQALSDDKKVEMEPLAQKMIANCNMKDITSKEIIDHSKGILYGNKSPEDADFTDIFEGDEISNTCSVDIAKLQMFFFTMVALITYCITLFQVISKDPLTDKFPALSEGFLVILGISYGGYVSSKTITNTK
jgi:ABC-type multidrug transport system fused ATPase/permease subunit